MISIFGGGFSGLTLAWELQKLGHEIVIYEKSSHLGGLIETIEESGLKHERAANAFLNTPEIRKLFSELEIEIENTQPEAKVKYIFRDGLKRWPLNFSETAALIATVIFKFIFFKKPKSLESVGVWGRRCLGKVATQYLLAPALTGVYAGDIEKMSASLVIGSLFKKKSKGRGSLRPKGGMIEFTKKIESKLKHKNCKFVLSSSQNIFKTPGIKIFAGGAEEAEEILACKLPMQSVAKITLKFEKPLKIKPGFGVLIPQEFSSKALGILFDANIFLEKVYAETWILGGARWPHVKDCTEAELVQHILNERKKLFQSEDLPTQVLSTVWQHGIPDYNFDLENKISSGFFKQLENQNIYFHGNYLGSIGLSRIYEDSRELAKRISKK